MAVVAHVAMAPVVLMIGGWSSMWSVAFVCAGCMAAAGVLSTLISMSLSPLLIVVVAPLSNLPCPLSSNSRGSALPSTAVFSGLGLPCVLSFAEAVVCACAGMWPTIILFSSLVGFNRSSSMLFKFIVFVSVPCAFVVFPSALLFVFLIVIPAPHLILLVPFVTSGQAGCPSWRWRLVGDPSVFPPRATTAFTPGVSIVTTSSANLSGIELRGTWPFLNAQFSKVQRPSICAQHMKGRPFATNSGMVGRSVILLLHASRMSVSLIRGPRVLT